MGDQQGEERGGGGGGTGPTTHNKTGYITSGVVRLSNCKSEQVVEILPAHLYMPIINCENPLDSWTCPLMFYHQCLLLSPKTLDIVSNIISLFPKADTL